MSRWFCSWAVKKITNIYKETDMKNRGKLWKNFLLLLLAFSLPLPAFSESVEVPELEPEAEYVMTGQDIMTLYTTINDLNETKEEWKNLTLETQTNSKNALELAKEYEKENKKLTLKNNFLIGGITVSVSVVVVGAIVWAFTK